MRTYILTRRALLVSLLLSITLLSVSPMVVSGEGLKSRSDVARERTGATREKLLERLLAHFPSLCSTDDADDTGDEDDENGDEDETEDDTGDNNDDGEAVGVGHLLISEVLFDLANDGSQGTEVGGNNEWVELYNPTDAAVDVHGWVIGISTSSGDVIASEPLRIAPGEYMVITDAESTADFWDFADVTVVYLDSSISGGLRNGGDAVLLFDASGAQVDAVSYGDTTTAFDPAVVGGTEGTSIARIDVTTDTDTAADWIVLEVPTPGF